jgi:uncharacterized YigZ family protein
MRILAAPHQCELIVQKSKFWGILEPVTDPERARLRLKEAKGRFADASHVVHAFRTGPEGSETMGCSDDGEPSGTAGRPVLDVLKGAGGGQALLLVVRWFGGTKLGTGGLVKAYGDTAKALVSGALWEELRVWVEARVTVDWAEHRPLRNELVALGAQVSFEDFASGVLMAARIPAEVFESLQAWTVDLTRGRSRWVVDSPPAANPR